LENYPALRNVSPEAKDLLMRLLQKDPTKRISTKQALNHKWFDGLKK
jgi:serine/threonine protein kinase